MKYRILPYKQGSAGAKALADALGGRVLKLEGSTFIPGEEDVLINWGNTSDNPAFAKFHRFKATVLNGMDIKAATNKLNFFKKLKANGCEDIIPRFWTKKEDIPDEAYPIVCRTVLAGHSGAGITIADTPDALVDAPLYVEYVKKQDEYRIHVGMKEGKAHVISEQRKARRKSVPDGEVNWKVRNLAGGFVFVRGECQPDGTVQEAARRALEGCGLDFGAVDVIWNAQSKKAYVLEVNTAPGLEGKTVDDYVAFFTGGSSVAGTGDADPLDGSLAYGGGLQV